MDTIHPNFAATTNKTAIQYLAKSVEYLAEADIVVFMDG